MSTTTTTPSPRAGGATSPRAGGATSPRAGGATERGLEFKVGLLIVVSTAIRLGFIFVLGNFSLRSGYTIYVDYDYIGALQPGAPVKVSGIKVGKVESVDFLGGK